MLEVAASEMNLISVARSIVGLGEPAGALLRGECALSPPSPGCVAALRETLAKGCVRRIASGGWRVQRRVRGIERATGRLWERYQAPELHFTSASEELLRWVTANALVLDAPPLERGPATAADDLFFYMTLVAAESAGVGAALAAQPAVRESPLSWLGFPDLLGTAAPLKSLPDFSWLADGVLVEALEDELARRWYSIESGKGEITGAAAMIDLGRAQDAVLDTFFAAIDRAKRRDLSRFAIECAAAMVRARIGTAELVANLASAVRLSERAESRAAAGAFICALKVVSGWVNAAESAHFIDDDYVAAQILLEIWETLGGAGHAALEAVYRELVSIDAVTEGGNPT